MPEYRRGLAERGGSAPVRVRSCSTQLTVEAQQISELCSAYLSGHLDETEIEYIADALLLCPDFRPESATVEEAIFLLSDSVANGPLNRETVVELQRLLSHGAG